MPEKINFIKKYEVDYVASQLPQDVAEWLYAETNAKVISVPHALNPKIFKPLKDLDARKIDIGNRSYEYPWYLGDTQRVQIFKFAEILKRRLGLRLDISTDPKKRFTRPQWADFLNNCKFTIADEAGSSYLERDDRTRKAVNEFLKKNPETTFDRIYEIFFKNYKNPVSGKIVSSRHFDAMGTKTCQILLEGRYNDILHPDEHYIELKKDFSNIEEVIDKIRDNKFRKQLVDNAYDYAVNYHTHKHRIENLLAQLDY